MAALLMKGFSLPRVYQMIDFAIPNLMDLRAESMANFLPELFINPIGLFHRLSSSSPYSWYTIKFAISNLLLTFLFFGTAPIDYDIKFITFMVILSMTVNLILKMKRQKG
jgi:hypothetical protein